MSLQPYNSTGGYSVGNSTVVIDTGGNVNGNIATFSTLSVTGNVFTNPIYASFWSNASQTLESANTAQVITLNNTDGHNNIHLGTGASNSQIIINDPGLYNLQFSAQLFKTSSSVSNAYIWLRQNGSDLGNTAGLMGVDRQTEVIQSWNFVINAANVGDYVELVWAASDTTVSMPAYAEQSSPWVMPAIPSVIVTIVPVGP